MPLFASAFAKDIGPTYICKSNRISGSCIAIDLHFIFAKILQTVLIGDLEVFRLLGIGNGVSATRDKQGASANVS